MDCLQVKTHQHIVARPGKGFSALGAVWTPLETRADARGWFAEIWRQDLTGLIRPRQISLSKTNPSITKAFHFHERQDDLFVPVSGKFRIVLLKRQKPCCGVSIWWQEGAEGTLRIPAGLAHGYRVEGREAGRMLYLTSETYSPADEGRLEWDQCVDGFPWKEVQPSNIN